MIIKKISLKTAFGFVMALLSAMLISQVANAADSLGTVTTYYTGWDYRNAYTILQDRNGNIWLGRDTEATKSLVKYVPSTNTYTDWTPNAPVLSLANGPDGNVWFTSGTKFGKIDSTGTKTEYSIPTEVRSSQTVDFVARAIATGSDGRLWVFTQSSKGDMRMFLYSTNGALYRYYSLNSAPSSASHYQAMTDLAIDPVNGRAWYAYKNNNTSRSVAGYLDINGNINEYTLPTSIANNIATVAIGSDGNTWYSGGSYYGYLEPNGVLGSTLYSPTTLGTGAAKIRNGIDGRLWGTHTTSIALAGTTLNNFSTAYVYQGFTGAGMYYSGSMPLGLYAGQDGNMWFTLYANYRIGKIGTGVSGSSIDVDNDGLTLDKETQQGTSDKLDDSDSDGLTDFVESTQNPDRDDTFCGSTECAYPHPMQKDVYVEVDWMVRPSDSASFKPTTTQLGYIKQAYASKGINLVFDTGEYGGGGQVPYHSQVRYNQSLSSVIDYYDYKRGGDGISAQFDIANRYKKWHYMLFGEFIGVYNDDTQTVSVDPGGVAFAGDDDAMIAFGNVSNNQSSYISDSFDKGISAIIMHELGHNECISTHSGSYGAYCVTNLTDNPATSYPYYISVMNTQYVNSSTSLTIDYSNNPTVANQDHDDWFAISSDLKSFANTSEDIGDEAVFFRSYSKNSTLRKNADKRTKDRLQVGIMKKDKVRNNR